MHQGGNCDGAISILYDCRRRVDFGLIDNPSADMSDTDLVSYVTTLRQAMPNVGESMVAGSLRSHGYRITRARIRNALHTSDPLSQALRWPGVLSRRRPYSVAGPNSLWHIGETTHTYG